MLTKFGTDVAIPLIVGAVVIMIAGWFIPNLVLRWIVIAAAALLLAFTLNFFRDPDRKTPHVDGGIIAPADGKIVLIEEVEEPEYLHGKAMQVSIFMSPLDVHVNRIPVSGRVEYFRYIKGEYVVAFDDKSSSRNERTEIGIDQGRFKVLFKQIAGFIARRIVCPLNVGDSVRAGERFGMIKFGSRVDVLMPLTTVIKVRMNQRTRAGETVLGVVPE